MSNIEEDIKILKESIKKANTEDADMNDCFETKELEAIENILSEREQDKNRINELEEENKLLLNGKVGVDLSYDDYIPVQKVKDKIKELKNEGNYRTNENPRGRIHFAKEFCDYKIEALEELLEEK